MQTQEDHSNPIPALNVDSLKVDLVVKQNTCFEKEDSNSENASNKLVKECSLNSETKDVHAIKYKMSKAKERCMAYFRSLHHYLLESRSTFRDTLLHTWVMIRSPIAERTRLKDSKKEGKQVDRLKSSRRPASEVREDTDADECRYQRPIYDE
ncbi:hypothetical protein Tco_0954328 [Tanacetum coccineum]|uniref:Uncharacterized protein n=1 Tax=Tanacetum coccineum TaxID=301880 RepID=A0ABQ5E3V8_9ASTR